MKISIDTAIDSPEHIAQAIKLLHSIINGKINKNEGTFVINDFAETTSRNIFENPLADEANTATPTNNDSAGIMNIFDTPTANNNNPPNTLITATTPENKYLAEEKTTPTEINLEEY